MTCQLYNFHDHTLDLAAAREVLRSPDATPDQIDMALTVLSWSHDWQDVDMVAKLRTAQDDRRDIARWRAAIAGAAVAALAIVAYERAVSGYVMGGM